MKTVLETLVPREAEVQTRNGQWYLMRMLPYRTVENVIEGAVLTFVDIAGQKRAEQKLRELSDELERRVKARIAELATANLNLTRETGQREQASRV